MSNFLTAISVVLVSFFAGGCVPASEAQKKSEYAGQEKREIKSLSDSDIEQLKAGKGWGLAKAAELNGYPGPIHVLDMKRRIGLSKEQKAEVGAHYEAMKSEAVPLGLRLIELEKQLNQLFSEKKVDDKNLKSHLGKIAATRADLRYVHLAAHLKTTKILSAEQVTSYNKLRGYDREDPCSNVPEGHNPELWKQHNDCK